jgi:hypothetical protein
LKIKTLKQVQGDERRIWNPSHAQTPGLAA